MIDPVLMSLFIHTCDIEQMTQVDGGDDFYGHTEQSWASVPLKQGVMCRFGPLSSEERIQLGMSGVATGTYQLWVLPEKLPPELQTDTGSATHRISNVRHKNGTLVEDGPFDITGVINPSGLHHHFKIMISRVSSGG